MEETVDSGDRSLSPSKKMSPIKSMEMSGEIDPETVRSALRDFGQSMKEAERERDEAMSKANKITYSELLQPWKRRRDTLNKDCRLFRSHWAKRRKVC